MKKHGELINSLKAIIEAEDSIDVKYVLNLAIIVIEAQEKNLREVTKVGGMAKRAIYDIKDHMERTMPAHTRMMSAIWAIIQKADKDMMSEMMKGTVDYEDVQTEGA